ncbi:UNVERIFIED_CONTAM: Cyanidin 3-O-galactoside 2''-O-xylosyltransferase FGGT1 [Sesamum radiatum]|uniref:Cyanidin 3-O-galactoside 2''-O-xylosyltransferase FGGT1 n=1 Tax=Sesamum radiatum TaxID=300843 RepID=A0AAW2KGQ2_SESRA
MAGNGNGTGPDHNHTLTIFMYPLFAMGHLIPYLLTANKLAQRGHKVFLVVPPKAQSKLRPLNLHPVLIQFKPISIPRVEGLPPDVETTAHFVFFDFMHWLPGLARRLKIKSVYYTPASPAAAGFLFAEGLLGEDLMNSPPGFPTPIRLYKHAALDLTWFTAAKGRGSGITLRQRFMSGMWESDAIGFKTCKETEGVYCQFLEDKFDKPILLAGPMVPKLQISTLEEKWATWLGKFKPKSVVFCAFGSETVLKG